MDNICHSSVCRVNENNWIWLETGFIKCMHTKKSKTFTFWQISQKKKPDSKAIYIATKAVSWYQFDDRTIDAIKTSFQVHKCKTSSESVTASGEWQFIYTWHNRIIHCLQTYQPYTKMSLNEIGYPVFIMHFSSIWANSCKNSPPPKLLISIILHWQ